MSTILEAVGDYLQSASVGTLGTNLFLGMMPETPDTLVAVYEYTGERPQFTMGSGATAIDRPMLQVVCRAGRQDYPVARDKAQQIRSLLGAVTQETLSGLTVLRLAPQGSVNPMGEDENLRPMVSVNFDCMVLP